MKDLITIEKEQPQETSSKKEKVKKRVLSWVEAEHINKAIELYLQSLKLIDSDEVVLGLNRNNFSTYSVYLERSKENE